jgi:hypothetical protein
VESALFSALPHFLTVSRVHLTEKCSRSGSRQVAALLLCKLRFNPRPRAGLLGLVAGLPARSAQGDRSRG